MPPPAKVLADADVRLIVPVPVMVVDVFAVHPFVPATVHVPEPIATVFAVVVAVVLIPTVEPDMVTLYVPASNVPESILKALPFAFELAKASCKVTEPPGVLIVN